MKDVCQNYPSIAEKLEQHQQELDDRDQAEFEKRCAHLEQHREGVRTAFYCLAGCGIIPEWNQPNYKHAAIPLWRLLEGACHARAIELGTWYESNPYSVHYNCYGVSVEEKLLRGIAWLDNAKFSREMNWFLEGVINPIALEFMGRQYKMVYMESGIRTYGWTLVPTDETLYEYLSRKGALNWWFILFPITTVFALLALLIYTSAYYTKYWR